VLHNNWLKWSSGVSFNFPLLPVDTRNLHRGINEFKKDYIISSVFSLLLFCLSN
jgi:hypothetical protein